MDRKARLLRYISDEQKEQGLWLLREMMNVTKYTIPELNKNGDICIYKNHICSLL